MNTLPVFNTNGTRNQILDKVLAFFSGLAEFKLTSRKIRLWTDVSPEQKPALFLLKTGEETRQTEGMPPEIQFDIELFIYTWANPEQDSPAPSVQIQEVLDAVHLALRPPPLIGRQTLDGLVSHCWIEGKTVEVPGDLGGNGIVIIPIRILLPS